ncbi:MAG: glycosyltransferase family 4 protein [Bryobacterales bacterium]|nr:glycosyltransferase family 4 protein [Bryobacterales bacterium]
MPRSLQRLGRLDLLITDAWVPRWHPVSCVNRRLRDRCHSDLKKARVRSWPIQLATFEFLARQRKLTGWARIMARNEWFGRRASDVFLKRAAQSRRRGIVFAYSYAALELLEAARGLGWKTVLGQIDPGIEEERLVATLHEQSTYQGIWDRAPSAYWERWQKECALADRIVVNSHWSRRALLGEGIPGNRIVVVPLAYEPSEPPQKEARSYPARFTNDRPMRVLFLGQVNLRKGMAAVLDTLPLLGEAPVEMRIVGPLQIELPEALLRHPKVHWIGAQPRSLVAKEYRQADVFLFPTLSDGFGITQLEAQSWELPIVSTDRCGDVVEHGRNGLILREITGVGIAQALKELVQHPETLAAMSRASRLETRFTLSSLSNALVELERDLCSSS